MAVSSNRDHFFQTTSSLDEIERRQRKATNNTAGNPLKLSSKILAVARNLYKDDDDDDIVYVAESASTVRAIAVGAAIDNDNSSQSKTRTTATWSGPTAPVTSICFANNGHTLWAGCWDKKIYTWDIGPGANAISSKTTPGVLSSGHTDFVKCLLSVRTPDGVELILSGGADGDIIFWSPLVGEGKKRLHVLKGQARGIEHMVLDPLSSADAPAVFVATSQRDVLRFTLPESTALKRASFEGEQPILAHETSVYKLFFDGEGDLWTASADKTAKRLIREEGWRADTTLVHPDFVRDVLVHERGGWVVTACRDEEVRVWNRATGDLHHVFSGHFDEVTGLCLRGDLLISVSIDATVRKWSLAPKELLRAVEEAKNPKEVEEEVSKPAGTDLGMLTAEEEEELRALMESEEAELQDLMAEDRQ